MFELVAHDLHTVMTQVRERTFALVAHLDEDRLNETTSPIMSPLSWDLGHMAAYEDLWLNHRVGGRELLREDLAALYDAFETPRAVRGDLEFLRGEPLREYMAEVRARALEAPVRDGGELHELVIRHELQHTETMLQAMVLAGIAPPSFTGPPAVDGSGLETVEIEEGPFELGSGSEGFAYDNERPRHTASTGRYTIGRTPVTNATWQAWADNGGYTERAFWSDAGWAWRTEQGIDSHPGGPRNAPVMHVTYFEAEAFARAHDARLPTEVEWEKAAPRLEGVGAVWEWTSSHFTGYPGFKAHPYREYSEVFFGDHYRVLRGGSCATHPRVASNQFRNWDLPERRQLFAGVRIAR
ncbi:ergothioneine biosynthesis protein EgtB [Solirubrobacter sp. CPCC 204708]|uniref:SUMF1/EgtB/PvdO family nonheme iron enzyme n=1 Tax=Solirubrobacter deserti TaxID=2282478 RepID=A0ABT4RKE7_9ACTN|nr:SUMF1/EgtB/PvdO family nonheme iron enzyme [Solirubrobacter deserti]MBE2317303.1 ergothioneine biosynthesis protein EgtB [Solirubrobacter deserti]MDA0139032.1 SUMF1/EgtB/PvdO family nonheme iron enzyme [Solirubrobacter deserti]